VEPRHTYNRDEKGFLIGLTGRSKRIFSKRMWDETLLACACADGTALPRDLIYAAAKGAIRSNWVEEIKAENTRSLLIISIRMEQQ
tara:strand:+ start:1866 stop:2123 length:258 start_codon:yes stop_codon:yes gene_type:complete